MILRALPLLFLAAAASVASAQESIEEGAARASAILADAAGKLTEATNARDKVHALTNTVRAYEEGLAILRETMRQASLTEAELTRELEAHDAVTSDLLGTLMGLQSAPEAATLLHPSGPLDSLRAGMILADATTALEHGAEELRTDLADLREVRALQQNALDTLGSGLAGAQEARAELSAAIAERRGGIVASATDSAIIQALVNSADTLEGFAESLATLPASAISPRAFSEAKGSLPLPANGTIVAGFDEPGISGQTRAGITIATPPRALVTSPFSGTIRYAGPLLDMGIVTIIEPAPDALIILAGLEDPFGQTGDVVGSGEPIGLMGGGSPHGDQKLIESALGTDADTPDTHAQMLYVEVRQDQVPRDPADWFALPGEQE